MIDAPAGFENLENLAISPIISWLISVVIVISVVLFFFMFVFGGIRWMLSGGKDDKVEGAKRQIKSAFVGLLIVFLSFAAIQFIEATLGISLMNINLPTSI